MTHVKRRRPLIWSKILICLRHVTRRMAHCQLTTRTMFQIQVSRLFSNFLTLSKRIHFMNCVWVVKCEKMISSDKLSHSRYPSEERKFFCTSFVTASMVSIDGIQFSLFVMFFRFLVYNFAVNTRTLPHPRHNNHLSDPRARDDQMIGKGYMPSPSPALPLDGSYYNMNSDRYLSYPPMVSAQIRWN